MSTLFNIHYSTIHRSNYIAHTKERWYKSLPSKQVIIATSVTQPIASVMAWAGIFMGGIPLLYVLGVWVWCFIWMQATEMVKIIGQKLIVPHFEK